MDCMLDIETLGSRLGSIILSLGAVAFDPKSGELGAEFYTNFNIWSCVSAGLTSDAATIDWWQGQSPEAKARFKAPEPVDLGYGLTMFRNWFSKNKLVGVWSHGLTFDVPMLTIAMERIGQRPPWRFQNARDTRTIFALCGEVDRDSCRVQGEIDHCALADAKIQARMIAKALARG